MAAEVFGRDLVVRWSEELLVGRTTADDSAYPDIAWLRGAHGWPAYWSRVWGARALLHLGPDRTEVVLAATADQSWRVRIQAWRALGRSEHR